MLRGLPYPHLLLVAAALLCGAWAPASPASLTRDGSYVLRPGDEVEIKVFDLPELDETVTIRPDGKLSLPLADDVAAAGMTPAELDAVLTDHYAELFHDPQVTVIVREFVDWKVFVGGEVGRPGLLPLTGRLTSAAAIMQAGGFTDSARRQEVLVLRDSGEGEPLVLRLNVKDVLRDGAQDVVLQPFDVVFVPKKSVARANLFIRQYVRDMLPIQSQGNFAWIVDDERKVVVQE